MTELFRHLMRQAHGCDSFDALLVEGRVFHVALGRDWSITYAQQISRLSAFDVEAFSAATGRILSHVGVRGNVIGRLYYVAESSVLQC